jgi:hypothetical protein
MRYEQPPVLARNYGRPPDDIDGLLRAFLRAEMPDPWPTMKFPTRTQTLRPTALRRWPLLNSRFALAATVALCLVGSMSLASIFSTDAPTLPGAKPDIAGPSGNATPINEVIPKKGRVIGRMWEKGNDTFFELKLEPAPKLEPTPMPEDE